MGSQFVAAFLLSLTLYTQLFTAETAALFSSKLVHRFSGEAVSYWASKGRNTTGLPERGSLEYVKVLLSSDLKRQKLKLGSQNRLLVPSQGSETYFYGNDMGWLHYAWIDLGTPNVSFLVALDAGSDLLWVPCNCIQCAPLSSSYYSMLFIPDLRNITIYVVKSVEILEWCSLVFGASIMQDKDLSEYNPSQSTTSKSLSCSHQLCQLGPNCQSPKESCPYTVNYYSENTSSSGFLFEDHLHLASIDGGANERLVQAEVIIGCGSKQSGSYLDGSAPDGLMGLGPGKISVPSLLAKSGLVPHSFSFCFDNSHSGSIYFGDQGSATQRTANFVPFEGEYSGYFVKVEDYCIGSSCFKQTGFQAQVDSGSSFTYLPNDDYKTFVAEFDRRVNATRSGIDDFPYCYKARSHGQPSVPSMKFMFAMNQSFVIENPMFHIINYQGADLFCLGILPMEGEIGIIGQNFMTGYRMVFDWENLKLGWSHSNCHDISDRDKVHLAPPPNDASVNPLPTNEQQRAPSGHAVAPAVAGRAPAEPSAASSHLILYQYCKLSFWLLQLTLWLHCLF